MPLLLAGLIPGRLQRDSDFCPQIDCNQHWSFNAGITRNRCENFLLSTQIGSLVRFPGQVAQNTQLEEIENA